MRKYTELLTVPIALVMLFIFNWVSNLFGWPVYGVEVLQKLFIGLVLFLVVIGLARVVFMLQFPQLYKFIDDDFNENKLWNVLTNKEKTLVGLGLFALFCWLLTQLVGSI